MTNEEMIKSLTTIRDGYLKLIDEKVDSGKVVGTDGLRGEWKSNTPLDDIYRHSAEALEMAIKALEQTGWILTSEKLPKKNGVYIASYEDAITLLYWFNGKWFFHPSNPAREETGTIIAWQPLPQPYRAEMEGEEC